MVKKILFLTHYFPPEVNAPANRTFEHCREWASEFDITVITNFPNHPDGKLYPGYKNKLIGRELIDGINVIRLWTFVTPNEGFVLRTINYIIYMILSVLYISVTAVKFDLLIATSPQFFCGLAGGISAKIRRKPFVLEIRDLWPESIIAVGALKNKTIIKILEKIEMWLYKSSTRIVSVTESFKENLNNRGIDEKKIKVFYNGVSIDIFEKGNKISDPALSNWLSGGFIVGYIGTIGMAHALSTFIYAAEELQESDVKFVIVGSGAEREKLERIISEKKLMNIKIFPIQPKTEIPPIINSLNLFAVHLKKNPLFKTVIPSKMFEGMIMKKAVLMGVEGEAARILEQSGGGILFEPENHKDLIEKINYCRVNKNVLTECGEAGFNYVKDNFNRKVIAARFLEMLKGLN